ncbi:unnamed protein product [Psylliodes chrysocephalus]|uniref:Cytochrome P450 n=1 Tax=Psylliodes chrysocephalus TaxID=3402493 RepID=A0A9P0CSS8_9CUCU|nr:unnamed protein product [Psylliodes chrysocephala]
MYFLLCVLIIMIPIWLLYLSIRCRLYIINIPMPRCNLLFGHAFEFLDKKRILSKFTEYCIEYGGIYKIYIPPKLPTLIISDPELIQQLTTTHLEKSLDYKVFKRWIGQGLLTADVKVWKTNRRLITPCFGRLSTLISFVDIFEKNGNQLVNYLENQMDNNSIDVFPLIKIITLNSMCETSMGVSKLNPDYMQTYCQSMQKLLKIYINRPSSIKRYDFLYRLSNDYIEEEKALKVVSEIFKMIMKEKINNNAEKNVDEENSNLSFLDMLLEIQTKYGLSKEYIRDEVNTFLLGGHDTTATAIAFTLYSLAMNQHIQDKVLAEQIELFGSFKEDLEVSHTELKQMKYLDLVIKESLRMFPPIPAIGRRITSDFKLGDYDLPKNMNVTVFIYGCHHNPKYFPEPDKFIPERFLDSTPSSFIPFSFGPRNCIGNKFAMLQMKSCISKVVRYFKLLPPKPDYNMNLIITATLFSENGIRLSLEKRVSSE